MPGRATGPGAGSSDRTVLIDTSVGVLSATLFDTPTADALWAALPLGGEAGRWGDEVYVYANVPVPREPDARQVVNPGELCYWCEGGAVAIPFGPTPISLGDECRLVAPVNVWGAVEGDPRRLAGVEAGTALRLTRGSA